MESNKDKKVMQRQCLINRYASQLYRTSISYYDRYLKEYGISSGMQFFLTRIYENPGITMAELADKGRFDKGTTTRAVKKLHAEGYVKLSLNENDKRSQNLFLTEEAMNVLDAAYQALLDWEEIITDSMSEEEIKMCETLMKKVADSSYQYIKRQGGYR